MRWMEKYNTYMVYDMTYMCLGKGMRKETETDKTIQL
jgi:hypothetical protein